MDALKVKYVHTFMHLNKYALEGGQKLTATSPIAIVHTKDNKKYVLYRYYTTCTCMHSHILIYNTVHFSCLKGMLVEINDQLLKDPQLLQTEVRD